MIDPPPDLHRRFEAVVLWSARPQGALARASTLAALGRAGIVVGVVAPLAIDTLAEGLARPAAGATDILIVDSRGSGAGVIKGTGVRPVPALDILDELWQRGIGPRDVLLLIDGVPEDEPSSPTLAPDVTARQFNAGRAPPVDGAVPLTGGSAGLLRLLMDQLRRRRRHALPEASATPGWSLVVEGLDPQYERVHEALLTLADGHAGTSGALLAPDPSRRPRVVTAGVYDGDGPPTHLLTGPLAFELTGLSGAVTDLRRILDLRAGILYESADVDVGAVESVRFASFARPTLSVLRVGCPKGLRTGPPLLPPVDDAVHDQGRVGDATWIGVAASTGGIVAAARQARTRHGATGILDRLAAYEADPHSLPGPTHALEALDGAGAAGFDRLLVEHREAWSRRWEDADVLVEGDDELQLAIRVALFHMMASAADGGEAAVGARGLTGTGYRGHVFWDSDVFVLPFLAATHPASARAMLEYRIRRLPVALATARAAGRAGARFPWESARTGTDVTPTSARDRAGRIVPIRTGQLEEHIVSDVAWAACCYVDWSGDDDFARGPGRRILVETARYWASRIHCEADGSAHIYGVIGPDEYHEDVDDNAYTNVMARWNLRRAAETAAGDGVRADEVESWTALADALVDGYDPVTGVYEQFAGFDQLEPLIIEEVAPRRPIAADVLLGAERVAGAQVIKQADVLLLHHLVPDEVVPGSLEANLRFYEPRTAHGSSLSPATHASLLARAGNFDESLAALRLAARMDLDDLTGSTAGGLHLATMGGLWQALAFGFAGLRPRAGNLQVDPVLPPSWPALELHLRFRGARVRVRTEHSQLSISTDRSMTVEVGGAPVSIGPGTLAFRRRGASWEQTS